ncbi:exodeoxyribonuclease V subunit beta [Borrelia sp. CA_690]|uniref:DNA 3'-5' helicase n=1 Tax=Borrelia maritima TaxID=2761123 RepID=A0A5J6WBW6_9SPIR|nr:MULTISPECIES: exodeoxyribonuclease V subunit beta [Borrelia]QFI14733.1 exodeoxyribonuclease V subunit beta [Borrelia maritima]WKC84594.1 exodeoxyribonuclease V subunit beta [Borrelia sp. CA_690]
MEKILEKIKSNTKILIEASAGTGKTHILENVVINLMKSKLYSINEILVLTFTKKATEEMRTRILKAIESAYFSSKTNEILKEAYKQSKKLFISTINKFALHALNNFQIETENYSKYRPKEKFSKEIDEIVYDFLRKSNSLIHNLDIKDYELKVFKSDAKKTEEIVLKIKKAYERDTTQELGNWLKAQTAFEKILIKKEDLIRDYNAIIEELDKMTADEILSFYNKHIQTGKLEIEYSKENDIFKIAETLLKNKFFSTLIEKETKKNIKLSPKELKIKNDLICLGTNIRHEKYKSEDNRNKNRNNLKKYVILKVEYKILKYIEKELEKIIKLTNTIDQNYIISNLKNYLKSEDKKLLNAIKNRYKIILIDEAQDLSLIQIEIFKILKTAGIKLIFIGDPKQIIYSFRKADISFYNKEIKNKINTDSRIVLKTNHRASKKIISPLNKIFNNIYNNTITDEIEKIEFTNSLPNQKNDNNSIFINGQEIEGINIISTNTENTEDIYQKTALTIKYLLTYGTIVKNNNIRNIKMQDIKVLCRGKNEIDLIDNALKKEQIQTNKTQEKFLKTKEFSEIFYIIKCLDRKQNFKNLNYILSSKILNVPWNLQRILIKQDKIHLIEEFIENITTLLEKNEITLINAINKIIFEKNLWIKIANITKDQKIIEWAQNKINYKGIFIKEGKLENLKNYETTLEIISKIYHKEQSIQSLISTLESLIINEEIEETPNNINNDNESIELMTIHKSKGLGMNIVFLINTSPIENNNIFSKKSHFYKFYQNGKIEYDFFKLEENKKYARLKILSEEKNIFYVGTTRAKFALFIIKINSITSKLLEMAKIFTINDIEHDFNIYKFISQKRFNKKKNNANVNTQLIAPKPIIKNMFKKEYTSSFSSLTAQAHNTAFYENYDFKNINYEKETELDDDSTLEEILPKGKDSGNILHAAMEEIIFNTAKDTFENFKKNNIKIIEKQIQKINSNLNTIEIQNALTKMIYHILTYHIKAINTRLCDIEEFQKEMEFLIKINPEFQKQKHLFDNHFEDFNIKLHDGYLKGIIDLIFKANNKIYILDYKTNYLGEDKDDYNETNLKNIIKKEYYDLQYKIYALGIKKILFKTKREYNQKFGGIIYLFTRAFKDNVEHSKSTFENGIYFDLPKFNDVDLDKIILELNIKRHL